MNPRWFLFLSAIFAIFVTDNSVARPIEFLSSPLTFKGEKSFCMSIDGFSTNRGYIEVRFARPANGQVKYDGMLVNRFSSRPMVQEEIELSTGKHTITIVLEGESSIYSLSLLSLGDLRARETACVQKSEPDMTADEPQREVTINKRLETIELKLGNIEKMLSKLNVGNINTTDNTQEISEWKKNISSFEQFLIEQSKLLQNLVKEVKALEKDIKK